MAEPIKPIGIPLCGKTEMKGNMIGWEGQTRAGFVKLDRMIEYSQTVVDIITQDGKDYYRIRENQRLLNGQLLEITSLVEIGERLRSVSRSAVRRNPQGEEIESSMVRFGDPSWGYPEDIYCQSALILILGSLFYHEIEETSVHLWQHDLAVTRIFIERAGVDDIATDLGVLPHRKFKLVVDIRSIAPVGEFFARLLQPLIPASYVWIWREGSDISGRMEMRMGPGNPKMVNTITGKLSGIPLVGVTSATDQGNREP